MIVPDRRMSWFRLLFEYRGSTLPRIRARLFAVFLVACVATVLSEVTGHMTDLTPLPFSLIGLALGVFLGFRNNTSYDRFWEGRRLWGAMVNDARSYTRLVLNLLAVDATPQADRESSALRTLQTRLVYRMMGYVHALRMHLRGETHDLAPLEPFLPPGETHDLAREHNVPIAMLDAISRDLQSARRRGWMRERDVWLFESKLNDITNVQGGCERIRATPIPYSYTLLIHGIVAAYCFALPFGVVASAGRVTPLVVVLIAYAFLGLDAVGDEIEDPFGTDDNDLPLSTLSRMIEVNLRQRLGETDLPALLTPDHNRVLR
jgi:putative membrane protein